jgi:hypothetical protein
LYFLVSFIYEELFELGMKSRSIFKWLCRKKKYATSAAPPNRKNAKVLKISTSLNYELKFCYFFHRCGAGTAMCRIISIPEAGAASNCIHFLYFAQNKSRERSRRENSVAEPHHLDAASQHCFLF